MVKENNELHYEIIKIREQIEIKETKWRAGVKALEDERADLNFVIKQKDFKIQQVEKEVQLVITDSCLW